MGSKLAEPIPDTIADIGDRVRWLITTQPDVVGYVRRALMDDSSLGPELFDALAAIGAERWAKRGELGLSRPDLDPIWGPLNPLVLALGTWIQRAHVDRRFPSRSPHHAASLKRSRRQPVSGMSTDSRRRTG